jgi:F-box and leucine-rich repeat protein GRR1
VLAVLENCRRVEQLYIGRCDLFTDATLRVVARFCPNLKRLHLAVFTAATDAGMIAVAKACSQLEEVKMANSARLTDASVEALMNNCPLLRVFVADAATAITPSTRAKMKKFCSLNCDRCNLQYLVDSPEL